MLYAPTGHVVEAVIRGPTSATPKLSGSTSVHVAIKDSSVTLTGTASGTSVVRWGKNVVIVVDEVTAYSYWNPRTTNSYDLSPAVSSVLVSGPYLVRSAAITSGTLALVGDLDGPTTLTVFAPSVVKTITWNGKAVKTSKSALDVGLSGSVGSAVPKISVPTLSQLAWKAHDSLPESAPSFDDSSLIIANKTSTSRPAEFQPGAGKYVLYSDEYGARDYRFLFTRLASRYSSHVWHVRFPCWQHGLARLLQWDCNWCQSLGICVSNLLAPGALASLTRRFRGTSGAASIFLNGKFLVSNQTLASEDLNFTLAFPTGSLITNGSNVLTVLVENTGMTV